MVINKKIIQDIRKEIPRNKYGNKEFLMGEVFGDIWHNCLYVKKKRGSCDTGYDCIDASIQTKNILDRNGISSLLARGTSEDGYFKSGHYFLLTGSVEIVDPVPLYKIVGSKHIPEEILNDEKMIQIENILPISTGCIVDYSERGGDKYLVSASAPGFFYDEYDKKLDSVNMFVSKPTKGKEQCILLCADIDENNIKSFRSQGFEPLERGASVDEIWDRILLMRDKDVIKIRRPVNNESSVSKITDDHMYTVLDDNLEVFLHLIENVPFIGSY